MNITDVDDKIIKNSNEEGVEYFEFARRWEADFFDDMKYISHHKANWEFAFLTISPELQSMCLRLWPLSKELLQMAMPILQMDRFTSILGPLRKNSNMANLKESNRRKLRQKRPTKKARKGIKRISLFGKPRSLMSQSGILLGARAGQDGT